jgi:hypothetical protein
MKDRHYNEELSAFADQELSSDDRQMIAEHILHCESCRRQYHTVRRGSAFAQKLSPADAPDKVWRSIDDEICDSSTPRLEAFAAPRWFDVSHFGAFATTILFMGLLAFFLYRGMFMAEQNIVSEISLAPPAEQETLPIANNSIIPLSADLIPANTDHALTENANAAPAVQIASWDVETIAGAPKIAGAVSGDRLPVGEYLETDGRSRARIEVASIGNVEIGPNSRVKLVGTNETQHRLSLERGSLHARIAAPPRLFIVDTPSAAAVDLGCEYTLEVDSAGNSKLNVTSGFVALEDAGRESIVPAGASCLTMKGKGLGTPFSAEATHEFMRALHSFDFGNGGSRAVKEIVRQAEFYDIITLWHLLSRVTKNDRPAVYDTLARFVAPPDGVTREGILSLNKRMLEDYRAAVETAWFE